MKKEKEIALKKKVARRLLNELVLYKNHKIKFNKFDSK